MIVDHHCLDEADPIDHRVQHLSGRRALVRRLRPDDAGPFQRYRNDPDTAAYQGWDIPYSVEAATVFVGWAMTAGLGVPGTWCQLAIESTTRCALAGDVGIHFPADDPNGVEVGVTLAPEARGAGIGAEAVALVLDHISRVYAITQASAWITTQNLPSRRLFERLGFTLVATEAADDGTEECHYIRGLST